MHFTLCDLAADIAQNAAESKARTVEVDFSETDSRFSFKIADDGVGMTGQELERAKDPFHSDGVKHPHRRVGLGIPFLIQTAEQSGGSWDIETRKGSGTVVQGSFDLTNLDSPPVGDVPGLCRTVLLFEGPGEIQLRRSYEGLRGGFSYEVKKTELVDALGSLEDAEALILLDRYLRSLEEPDQNEEED